MATKAKTNKPTAKFGGLKRSKPTWKFGLIALIAVLVLTSAGYVGYGKYKEHSLKAHAANWKLIYSDNTGFAIWGCKTNINSVYGQLTSVNLLAARGNAYDHVSYSVQRPIYNVSWMNATHVADKTYNAWWGGTTILMSGILLSPSHNDYLSFWAANNRVAVHNPPSAVSGQWLTDAQEGGITQVTINGYNGWGGWPNC
jgi:hypothetical protein